MKGIIGVLILLFAISVVPVTAAGETLRVQINKEKRSTRSRVTVRFVELVDDSRCPTDTNCIWAGSAKIKVRVTRNGRSQLMELETNGPEKSHTAFGYTFRLTALTPHPRSNIRINRNGYIATLEVQKLGM